LRIAALLIHQSLQSQIVRADDEWAQLTAQSFNCTRNHCKPSSASKRAWQQAIRAGSTTNVAGLHGHAATWLEKQTEAPASARKNGKPYMDDVMKAINELYPLIPPIAVLQLRSLAMKLKTSLAALMVAASLFGCATSSHHGVNLNLVATRQNAGQIGTVTLTDWDKKTGLSFFISGAPSGVTLPLRLYSFINNGTCEQPGSVAYAMNDTVNTERQPIRGWSFTRTAPVPLQTLVDGKYSVVVRTAATDGNVDIFCGDIKATEPVK
jgi:hypothetical protein